MSLLLQSTISGCTWVTKIQSRTKRSINAGISEYPNFKGYEFLTPASEDIKKLKTYLHSVEHFDEVIVLENAGMSLENLDFFFNHYLPDHFKDYKTRFLFAYSGHGTSEEEKGYLLNYRSSGFNDHINRISMGFLRELMDESIHAAHQSLVLINACYSGHFLVDNFEGREAIPVYPGAHAITAGGSNEIVWSDRSFGSGSIFFEKVLAGLEGYADIYPKSDGQVSGDGIITSFELATYLRQEIQIFTNQNFNPHFGDLYDGGSRGSFFFMNQNKSQEVKKRVSTWRSKFSLPFGDSNARFEGLSSHRERVIDQLFLESLLQASDGELHAMIRVGQFYKYGLGRQKSYDSARYWFGLALEKDYPPAMLEMSDLYLNGFGVDKDYQVATKLIYTYDRLSEEEKYEAQTELLGLYLGAFFKHEGSFINEDERPYWFSFRELALEGNVDAMYHTGAGLYSGDEIERDFDLARKWFTKAAELGHLNAMHMLGWMHYTGDGVKKDFILAKKWWYQAAELGHAESALWLGHLYLIGYGQFLRDISKALKWYEKSGMLGNVEAMRSAAECYQHGSAGDIEINFSKSTKWYKMAYDKGDTLAATQIGSLYYLGGYGIEQNFDEARLWLERAMEVNDAEAMYYLSVMYFMGESVTQNFKQAFTLCYQSAEMEFADAFHMLALLYEKGYGTSKNCTLAKEWYSKAAAFNNPMAIERLKEGVLCE